MSLVRSTVSFKSNFERTMGLRSSRLKVNGFKSERKQSQTVSVAISRHGPNNNKLTSVLK
jgi:hypothetical protein